MDLRGTSNRSLAAAYRASPEAIARLELEAIFDRVFVFKFKFEL
jgi:hypothetical protein